MLKVGKSKQIEQVLARTEETQSLQDCCHVCRDFKQGKYQEALEILQKCWDLRRELAVYDHKV